MPRETIGLDTQCPEVSGNLFVRPQMSVARDLDGKPRGDNPLLTAGPYEADPKFLPGTSYAMAAKAFAAASRR
jgi:hypothetical protein